MAVKLRKRDAQEVRVLTEKAISQNVSPETSLNQGLVAGMEIIKPLLVQGNVKSRGKVIIDTVKGIFMISGRILSP